ncbi:Ser/Thr protein phosphatase family protein [Aspergillus piperis CBS 112811]|uniref:Ser/Thr protein phosphatase family protein n=1 Tax=Aspergillus piperis CBS 112811 TaxID=1448313 RepID=A0A8G1VNC9_9EURO|nr:Ser/Thr protein phosphatase family protein [Aspergillus piperis CBS 112811]RAH58655.1 Ser/Thr protein phosphatase family protein [Aspergillus piperis CBS 112811]
MTTVKTSILLLSDTHTLTPSPPTHPPSSTPYRHPLPATDLLIHAGDLTKVGHKHEHLTTLSFLQSAPAPLKLIIPGNHDITLDEPYYKRIGHYRHRYRTDHTAPSATAGSDNVSAGKLTPGQGLSDEELREIKELYTGQEAQDAGIRYLEEGMHVFRLGNGAVLRVYASPYTPEFCQWGFAYPREVDRYNPPEEEEEGGDGDGGIRKVVPDYPGVDVMITHGPPYGVLDQVVPNHMSVGCEHLYRAVKRARPRLHVFGHIHEGYGATRREWSSGNESVIQCDKERTLEERCARVDVSGEGGNGLRVGEETLFVNASVVTVQYHAVNAPWVVEMDLPTE